MQINCIVRTLTECGDGVVSEAVAHEVDPAETVGEMMDRLVGWDGPTYSWSKNEGDRRRHDSSTLVELRVAKPKTEKEG